MNNDFFAPETNPQNQSSQNAPRAARKANGLATVSMICGILSIVVCCCAGLPGMILALVAFVLALVSRRGEPMRGAAIAGIICSIIGFILSAIVLVYTCFIYYSCTLYATDPQSCYNWLCEIFGADLAAELFEIIQTAFEAEEVTLKNFSGIFFAHPIGANGLLR